MKTRHTLLRIYRFLGVDYEEYYLSDKFLTEGIKKNVILDSWNSNPKDSLSKMSVGKHKSSKFDFTKISRVKLCNKFAAEIGIPEFKLSELAKHYGYNFHQVEKHEFPKKNFMNLVCVKGLKTCL